MINFKAKGHQNILGKHRNTIEFTKDQNLTLQGDCIIGVNSDFNFNQIKEVLKWNKAEVVIEAEGLREIIRGTVNKNFSSEDEIVFRKSNFLSERTLLIRCDKACIDLNRNFIDLLKNNNCYIDIIIKKIN